MCWAHGGGFTISSDSAVCKANVREARLLLFRAPILILAATKFGLQARGNLRDRQPSAACLNLHRIFFLAHNLVSWPGVPVVLDVFSAAYIPVCIHDSVEEPASRSSSGVVDVTKLKLTSPLSYGSKVGS